MNAFPVSEIILGSGEGLVNEQRTHLSRGEESDNKQMNI